MDLDGIMLNDESGMQNDNFIYMRHLVQFIKTKRNFLGLERGVV